MHLCHLRGREVLFPPLLPPFSTGPKIRQDLSLFQKYFEYKYSLLDRSLLHMKCVVHLLPSPLIVPFGFISPFFWLCAVHFSRWLLRSMLKWRQPSYCRNLFKSRRMSLLSWQQNFLWCEYFLFLITVFVLRSSWFPFFNRFEVQQICQHMKSSGKEQSLPYQVISR